MTPRWPRADDALLGLALVAFLMAFWAVSLTLYAWVEQIDGYSRVHAYSTPRAVAPLERCRYAWQRECLP